MLLNLKIDAFDKFVYSQVLLSRLKSTQINSATTLDLQINSVLFTSPIVQLKLDNKCRRNKFFINVVS